MEEFAEGGGDGIAIELGETGRYALVVASSLDKGAVSGAASKDVVDRMFMIEVQMTLQHESFKCQDSHLFFVSNVELVKLKSFF
jgi:hypothetical protein